MKRILFIAGVFALVLFLLSEAKHYRKRCKGILVRGTCVPTKVANWRVPGGIAWQG